MSQEENSLGIKEPPGSVCVCARTCACIHLGFLSPSAHWYLCYSGPLSALRVAVRIVAACRDHLTDSQPRRASTWLTLGQVSVHGPVTWGIRDMFKKTHMVIIGPPPKKNSVNPTDPCTLQNFLLQSLSQLQSTYFGKPVQATISFMREWHCLA